MDWAGSTQTNEQGSKSWLEWRSKGLGSSDAPVLMGVSPWKSLYQLWLEKTNQAESFRGNWATERGNRLEPIARDKYNAKYMTHMEPETFEHPTIKYLRASVDGVDHSVQRLIEIKCPGKVDHQTALEGRVPDKYYPQLQWLMMVSGVLELHYVSWDGETDLAVVEVKPDPNYQITLLKKAAEFWQFVETKTPPPTAEAQIEDQELTGLLMQYDTLKTEIDALTLSFDMIKDSIRERVKVDTICSGFKIRWTERKGLVDYGKIPALQGVDLEPFRKAPTKAMTITKAKDDKTS